MKKMLIVVCYIAKRDSIILISPLLKHEHCAVLEVFLRLQSKLGIYLPYHCNKFAIFYMCICMCIYIIIYRNKKEKRETIKVEKAIPSHTQKTAQFLDTINVAHMEYLLLIGLSITLIESHVASKHILSDQVSKPFHCKRVTFFFCYVYSMLNRSS